MENKTSKYLKYAIGEIVLVVIGILIALQINNWNEGRKQNLAETEFLTGIKNDLIQDKNYIKLILGYIEPKMEAFKNLNQELPKYREEHKVAIDSLLHAYLFVGQHTFYPISGSFQSAVAGNEINAYKNKEIISSIIKLYNSTYPRLIDNANILDDRWDKLTEKYLNERRTNYIELVNDEKASKVLNDIYHHFLQLNWYNDVLKKTVEDINIILQKIDDKIL